VPFGGFTRLATLRTVYQGARFRRTDGTLRMRITTPTDFPPTRHAASRGALHLRPLPAFRQPRARRTTPAPCYRRRTTGCCTLPAPYPHCHTRHAAPATRFRAACRAYASTIRGAALPPRACMALPGRRKPATMVHLNATHNERRALLFSPLLLTIHVWRRLRAKP